MQDKLECLERIIAEEWKVKVRGKIELIEKQRGEILYKFEFSTSGRYLLYKFEKDGNLDLPLLSQVKNVRKICDYVLFTVRGDMLYALMFELKQDYGNPSEQLWATRLLVEYLIKTAQRVCKLNFEKVKYGRFGISNKTPRKTSNVSKKHFWISLSYKNRLTLNDLLNQLD